MKLYTCHPICSHEDCGGFHSALNFLHSWGIEPKILMDEEGHYFEFDAPPKWTRKKLQKFCDALNERITPNFTLGDE